MRPERLTINPDVAPHDVAKSVASAELCQRALEAARAGDFADAFSLLEQVWDRAAGKPRADMLSADDSAEIYLCAGTITSLTAHSWEEHLSGRGLLRVAARIFRAVGDGQSLARCLKEVAAACLRSGHNLRAMRVARAALAGRSALPPETEANLQLIVAIAEWRDNRLEQALETLQRAYPLFEAVTDPRTCGIFHNTLGLALEDVGLSAQVGDYIQRAVIEFTAASYYFELCGDVPFLSNVENNIGFLLSLLGQYSEAYSHLERARSLALAQGDELKAAQIEDTRARALCAEGRLSEAELLIDAVVEELERLGAAVPLTEAQATRANIRARVADTRPKGSNVILFPAPLTKLPERYVVQVSDDSLLNAGIGAGDGVWVRRAFRAQDGDLVFASTPDGPVLAFYYEAGDKAALVFAGDDCSDRSYPAASVHVLGIAQ